MARNKQAQKQKKDGQHRKETKEERRARLKSQQEAREVSENCGSIKMPECPMCCSKVSSSFFDDSIVRSSCRWPEGSFCCWSLCLVCTSILSLREKPFRALRPGPKPEPHRTLHKCHRLLRYHQARSLQLLRTTHP